MSLLLHYDVPAHTRTHKQTYTHTHTHTHTHRITFAVATETTGEPLLKGTDQNS
jgi:hypothetical protein